MISPDLLDCIGSEIDEEEEEEDNGNNNNFGDPSCSTSQHTSTNNNESASALVIAASDKAGMDGIDRTRIDEIILRESKNTKYMIQQRKRDENVNIRIKEMKKRLEEKEEKEASKITRNNNKNKESCCSNWRKNIEDQIQPDIDTLLKQRHTRSTCVVVDMDAFYMSCELLSKPHLNNKPSCVGHGMILTSNYVARKYGVRSAMAGWIGDKLVSELSNGKEKLIHVPSNFDLYNKKSSIVRNVLSEYDPNMKSYSLDEAYLNIGPYLSLKVVHNDWTHEQISSFLISKKSSSSTTTIADTNTNNEKSDIERGKEDTSNLRDELPNTSEDDVPDIFSLPQDIVSSIATSVVSEMRSKVYNETNGLTCSAGLASNFMLAKIASDQNKPNGQLIIGPSNNEIIEFVHKLPIRKIPGIGRVTEKILHSFDIITVKDLYDQRALVQFLFSRGATASSLLRASLGCSSNDNTNDDNGEATSEETSSSEGKRHKQKGISRERTFQEGKTFSELISKLQDIATNLISDMKRKKLHAQTITLKVKLHTFDIISRSQTLPQGVYMPSIRTSNSKLEEEHTSTSDRGSCSELIKIVTEMLSEVRRQHTTSNNSNKSKGSTGSRSNRSFSVRLLGVRCSNFLKDNDNNKASEISNMNIKKFLCNNNQQEYDKKTNNQSIKENNQRQNDQKQEKYKKSVAVSPYRKKKRPLSSSIEHFATTKKKTTYVGVEEHEETANEDDNVNNCRDEHLPVDDSINSGSICPMCNQLIHGNNDVLNRHIDSCLSTSTIKRVIKEESSRAECSELSAASRKTQRLTDFFSTTQQQRRQDTNIT